MYWRQARMVARRKIIPQITRGNPMYSPRSLKTLSPPFCRLSSVWIAYKLLALYGFLSYDIRCCVNIFFYSLVVVVLVVITCCCCHYILQHTIVYKEGTTHNEDGRECDKHTHSTHKVFPRVKQPKKTSAHKALGFVVLWHIRALNKTSNGSAAIRAVSCW
eukprot:m.71361 g.71361  ORF g.71361 m.71361 type:complete len:161 (+) comp12239_c0_seq2:1989-2471(+)